VGFFRSSLTLEKVDSVVIYHGIFITLAPGGQNLNQNLKGVKVLNNILGVDFHGSLRLLLLISGV
jgi:hypothetical protein